MSPPRRSRTGRPSARAPRIAPLMAAVVRRPNLTTAPTYTRHVHDALRRRAREGLVSGAERAPARAHFRAMGIDPARLGGPIVGIASTWTGTMPCNLNQLELAARVADGVTAAGGVPLGFNTIAVSDNQSQATPGMRASLISREVIADSIELMVHAHDFDALVCVVGCDKTVPAALMALARVDKPAVVLYSGPMRAGRLRGREVTIQDVWEAVGAEERGLIPRDELDELERVACPGPGDVRRALHREHDGGRARLSRDRARSATGLIPADETAAKDEAATRAGARAVELSATARTFLDKRALLNAMAGIAATGGSTNGILHLLAIAHEAGVPLTLDELADVGSRTPVIASLAPSGRFMAEDLHRVGGTASLIRELVRGGHVDGSAPTVDGSTLEEATRGARAPGRRGALHARRAVQADGRAARAARQPCARRKPREARRRPPRPPGPARRLRQRGGLYGRRARGLGDRGCGSRRSLRRPGGRAGDARDAQRHRVGRRRGPRRVGGARHRRPLLGCDAWPDGRPRGAGSGTRWAARDRSRRRDDHDRHRREEPDRRARRRGDRRTPRRLAATTAPLRRRRLRALPRARRFGVRGRGAPTMGE